MRGLMTEVAAEVGLGPPAGSLAEQLRWRGLPPPVVCVGVLLLLGALSRWATRAELVQAWDAGNFVLALSGYDLPRHQPHLPASFWWLISLGRLSLPLTGGNGVAALTLVNALTSAVALPFGWYLGFRCGGLRTAWWMVGLLFSAPLLWFYASQPLSYGAELGWVMAIGCCSWCVASGERRFLPPLVLLMATAGGVRPNTALFLLPLVLVCCLRGWRRGLQAWRLLAGVALGAGVLCWWGHAFLVEAGGFEAYWTQLMAWKGSHTQQASSRGVFSNAWLLIKSIALTAPAGLALALASCRRPFRQPVHRPLFRPPLRPWRRSSEAAGPWLTAFLLLWALPSAFYFVLVHFTRMGHATTLLPALLLPLSLRLAAVGAERGPWRWPRDLALVVSLQCVLFLLVPGDRFAAHLRDFDREWGVAIQAARRFDPATTLVLASGRSGQRAYRLPSVHLPAYDHGEADLILDQVRETIEVKPPLERLLVFDRGLGLSVPAVPGTRVEALIPGRLQMFEVPIPPEGLKVGRRQVSILPPEAASEER